MACAECRTLNAHEFRSADDLVHAFQVAAAELDRGVLERVTAGARSAAEQDALDSAFSARELPGAVHYRFRCTTCGDRFDLAGDMREATGSWTRQPGPELPAGTGDRNQD